jgi:hypothetical protein
MKKVYYEKVGDDYVPVSEYDSDFLDSFKKGTHIVMSYPGGKSTRYNIDPAYGPMIAAGRVAEDAMATALVRAGELRLQSGDRSKPMTQEQHDAWHRLVEVFGDSAKQLEWPSAREVAEAGVNAMMAEAEKLLEDENVRRAWERFLFLSKITKDHTDENSN